MAAMMKKPTIKQLMELTQLSRATIDRALNRRPGVHQRTLAAIDAALRQLEAAAASERHAGRALGAPTVNDGSAVGATVLPVTAFRLIAQAGDAFTDELMRNAELLAGEFAARGVRLEVVPCVGATTADVVEQIYASHEADGIGIICKTKPRTNDALRALIATGKAVVSVITDVDADARHGYVGINNRAAGQSAAFLIGRHLQAHSAPKVAVVLSTFAYACHEGREIGFRSLIRHRFPHVRLLEVIDGGDTDPLTYAATKKVLAEHGPLDGIYNIAGGNGGLAAALREFNSAQQTLFVAHEINHVTTPLLRSGEIDYVLTQDVPTLLRTTVDQLTSVLRAEAITDQKFLTIETYSQYSL
jgi:LacI family transcriptional regulator